MQFIEIHHKHEIVLDLNSLRIIAKTRQTECRNLILHPPECKIPRLRIKKIFFLPLLSSLYLYFQLMVE
jgi:predicted Zn-ribbon and HTH transcriptional regulator